MMDWFEEICDEEVFEEFNFIEECDKKVIELKQFLSDEIRKSIKADILEELERLRAENKELQYVKENWEDLQQQYKSKMRECENKVERAKQDMKKCRLDEIMSYAKLTLYQVERRSGYREKCDKCNEYRSVEITLPSGRTIMDDCCNCSGSKRVYIPEKKELYKLSMDFRQNVLFYYQQVDKDEYCPTISKASTIVDHNKDFETLDVSDCELFFVNKEECKAFCDYINKKNESEEYKYDYKGNLLYE